MRCFQREVYACEAAREMDVGKQHIDARVAFDQRQRFFHRTGTAAGEAIALQHKATELTCSIAIFDDEDNRSFLVL